MCKFWIEEMSWKEVKEVLAETDLAILPVGSTEEHGPHLPLSVDTSCVSYIAEKTAHELFEKDQIRIIIAPCIPYGETNLTEFPGTLTIRAETLISLTYEISLGLISHGVRKIIFLNGHYGNFAPLVITGRKIIYKYPDLSSVVVNWWNLASEIISEIRESEMGGMFHASELEASVFMNIQPENVHMEKAVKDILKLPVSHKFFMPDTYAAQMVTWIHSRKAIPKSGAMGDPTKATREKGEIILNTVITNLRKLIMEMMQKGGGGKKI